MPVEYLGRGRGYKPRRFKTQQKEWGRDVIDILDERMKIDLELEAFVRRYKLRTEVVPVLNIPLTYNSARGVWELGAAAQEVDSRLKGYYYGASLPTEVDPGYYPVAIDDRHRLLVKDDRIGKLELIGSTTTPLAASGEWTSPVDSLMETGRIVGSVYADVDGTLYVEQSPDNSNWDIVDSFSITGGSGIGFSVEKVAQYARVRYVNGATDQTVFRLYVYRRLRIL